MELHGYNLLGSATSAEGTEKLQAVAPATGHVLDTEFIAATDAEINRALRLASTAFWIYRRLEAEQRAAFLDKIAEAIAALGDELIERAHAETALPIARLTGERGRTIGQLRQFAAVIREGSWVEARIDRAQPDRAPAPRPDLRRMLIPLGPVAVFGASNFPFAFSVAGGDTASALAAGCPVIVKAHPSHLGTSEMVGRAILEAARETGMPEGVFSMLHGRSEIGVALVRHPALAAVGFTGSRAAGTALFAAAAARECPIPVYAEMSSINPVFVLPGALKERGSQIAAGLAQSVTLGVGQFCTNPGIVVGFAGGDSAFRKLAHETAELMGKTAPASMLNLGIYEAYGAGITNFAATVGVHRESIDGRQADSDHLQPVPAVFLTSAETFLATPALGEEVFGPATLSIVCGSVEEMEAVAGSLPGQLTASVHATSDDLDAFRGLIAILETKVGRLVVNGFPTGVEVSPAMQHGGPFPATTDSRSTSVGTAAIARFARPICYQDAPASLLPDELQDGNPRGILRVVDGEFRRGAL